MAPPNKLADRFYVGFGLRKFSRESGHGRADHFQRVWGLRSCSPCFRSFRQPDRPRRSRPLPASRARPRPTVKRNQNRAHPACCRLNRFRYFLINLSIDTSALLKSALRVGGTARRRPRHRFHGADVSCFRHRDKHHFDNPLKPERAFVGARACENRCRFRDLGHHHLEERPVCRACK